MTSHACGPTEPPLIEDTLGRCFEAVARRFPDRDALVSRDQWCRFSYAELDAESNRLASALLRLGLVAGDRAGVWADNGYEWVLLQLATAKVGIVLVHINPNWRPGELEYALENADCRLLVTMSDFAGNDELGRPRPPVPGGRSGAARLRAARLPRVAWMVQIGNRYEPGTVPFTDLLSLGHPADPAVRKAGAALRATDAIDIQFTCGTTERPKGVTLTHRNILNNGFFAGEAMRLTEHDRVCIPVPLHHWFGSVLGNLACLTHGAAIVYPSSTFDALSVLRTVQEERCTALHGVPAMFMAELAHPRFAAFDLSSLRTGIMAGAPCPLELLQKVARRMNMAEVTTAYGMTETSPVNCQTGVDTPLALRAATVGRVHPHVEIKVADAGTGHAVPRGIAGELCVRGYCVMDGYWDDPARTAEAIDAEGWLHTGDLASMDENGYVRILGRIGEAVCEQQKGKRRRRARAAETV